MMQLTTSVLDKQLSLYSVLSLIRCQHVTSKTIKLVVQTNFLSVKLLKLLLRLCQQWSLKN